MSYTASILICFKQVYNDFVNPVNHNEAAVKKALVIVNPVSGIGNPETLKRLVSRRMGEQNWQVEFHDTTAEENLSQFVSSQVGSGFDLIIVAGGDGTIAEVASGLVNSDIPLGIIPSGTWNAIARHLGIPLTPLRAVHLILGPHSQSELDLMAVGDHYHAMNLGIGFSASMIQGTHREEKRHAGNLAYFRNAFIQIFGIKLIKYQLVLDGKTFHGRASEIMVANYGVIGLKPIESVLNIHPDDGKVDVLVVRARTLLDVPSLVWQVFIKRQKRTPIYRLYSACQNISIHTSPSTTVQADGEIIGKTPVEIQVIPRCVKVLTPKSKS